MQVEEGPIIKTLGGTYDSAQNSGHDSHARQGELNEMVRNMTSLSDAQPPNAD